jgi:hypothetical protein
MGIADWWLGPPPSFGHTLWDREICYRAADERIHMLDQGQPPRCPGGDFPTLGGMHFKQVSLA